MPERLVEVRYGPATVAVVLLLVVLLAGGGCSAAAPERVDAPSTPPVLRAPSPSPPDPVSAAAQAALAAYAGMWAAYDEAGRAPQADPDHPALAQFVTRDALEGLRTGLGRLRERGLVFEGGYALTAPEVVDLDPPDAPTRAEVEDCLDSRDWVVVRADGGEYDDEPGGRRAVFADIELGEDGVWRVTGFALRAVGTC